MTSTTGPSQDLYDALDNSRSVSQQTRVLWRDPKNLSWDHRKSYKFVLSLNAARKKIRVNVYEGSDIIISSPEMFAGRYRGGRLGMVTMNQGNVIWTALDLKCLDL